jgi:hypothetical protein
MCVSYMIRNTSILEVGLFVQKRHGVRGYERLIRGGIELEEEPGLGRR